MMFPKQVLLDLRGFDARYFMYGEDIDLCYRIKQLGLKTYYLSTVHLFHYHGASAKKHKQAFFSTLMQKESVYMFMLAHYGPVQAFLYRIAWLVTGSMRVILLGIVYAMSCLIGVRQNVFSDPLSKYFRVIVWSAGSEKWTREGR